VPSHSPIPIASTESRIVATLGPSSFGCAATLIDAGATELRLNASHMTPAEVFGHCERLRQELPTTRLVVDLQGKKMRLGVFEAFELSSAQTLVLSNDPNPTEGVFVPHRELFEQVALGEHLSIDDGKIEIEITERGPRRICARVLRSGTLFPRKGINRAAHPLILEDLSLSDRETIRQCLAVEGVDFAISFVEDGSEADWVRRRAPNRRVILKVERPEAIEHLDALSDQADELWICRGDLGAQLGFSRMAREVARIEPRRLARPVLMAGQVLEHLSTHAIPTRTEVCHLYDLTTRGYSGIVLSDETAVGNSPVVATEWAARLMHEFLA
jgi:pyruvate kinase